MPKLYRKRPVTIEAVQYHHYENLVEVIDFLAAGHVKYLIKSAGIVIRTLEGDMLAEDGDYIIKGIKGEYYPVKSEIFLATYEALL